MQEKIVYEKVHLIRALYEHAKGATMNFCGLPSTDLHKGDGRGAKILKWVNRKQS